MRAIADHALWLGHAGDVRDVRILYDTGIQAIIDLAGNEPPPQLPRSFTYCRFPLFDDGNNPKWLLQVVIHTLADLISLKIPTLVFCSAGLSRTPAIAAAALATVTQLPIEQCLKTGTDNSPADVSPALWLSIKEII